MKSLHQKERKKRCRPDGEYYAVQQWLFDPWSEGSPREGITVLRFPEFPGRSLHRIEAGELSGNGSVSIESTLGSEDGESFCETALSKDA